MGASLLGSGDDLVVGQGNGEQALKRLHREVLPSEVHRRRRVLPQCQALPTGDQTGRERDYKTMRSTERLCKGERVEVRSPTAIASTFDESGEGYLLPSKSRVEREQQQREPAAAAVVVGGDGGPMGEQHQAVLLLTHLSIRSITSPGSMVSRPACAA